MDRSTASDALLHMPGPHADAMADDLRVQELSLPQIRRLYHERLRDDFPPDELKPLGMIERALAAKRYVCYGAFHGDQILGYAYFVKLGKMALVDYYAVMPEARDRGVGSAFLQALIAGPLRDMDCALLEVEDPECAPDPVERETRQRRLRFYLRNGLTDTGVRATVFGVPYGILTLPLGTVIAPDAVRDAYARLYRTMLPKEMYDNNIQI